MKLFDERADGRGVLDAALAHAAAGGQALHVWDPGNTYWPDAPRVFAHNRPWAHLFDLDRVRLEATARALGVRVVVVGCAGRGEQHVDLCGRPLDRAIAACAAEDAA